MANHLRNEIIIDNVEGATSCWIACDEFEHPERTHQVLVIRTGAAVLQFNLTEDDTIALIGLLQKHLFNIETINAEFDALIASTSITAEAA